MTVIRRDYARAIWLAMVNDEAPDDETLAREGYFDAADAVIALADQHHRGAVSDLVALRQRLRDEVDAGRAFMHGGEPYTDEEFESYLSGIPGFGGQ